MVGQRKLFTVKELKSEGIAFFEILEEFKKAFEEQFKSEKGLRIGVYAKENLRRGHYDFVIQMDMFYCRVEEIIHYESYMALRNNVNFLNNLASGLISKLTIGLYIK